MTQDEGERMRPGLVAVLSLFAVVSAIAFLAAPARAGGGDLEGGGEPQVQLFADIVFPADVVHSGVPLPIRVQVVDQTSAPVEGVAVAASADGATVTPSAAVTDAYGIARFTFTAQVTRATEFTIAIMASSPGAIADLDEVHVFAIPVAQPRPILTRAETVSASLGLAALLTTLATTEFGKYGLFNVIVFPLYSRLKKEEVLDHFVRGQIYGYIAAHPGEHYNSLKDALKVTNGTLAHHLRMLEMQGFVKSAREGIYKRFYPVEMQIPRDKGIRLSDLQHNILALIRDDGGPTQHEIAQRLDVSQQTVSYNLRALGREGLVRMEKVGRSIRYFPEDT